MQSSLGILASCKFAGVDLDDSVELLKEIENNTVTSNVTPMPMKKVYIQIKYSFLVYVHHV